MKIFFLITGLGVGGAERQVVDLSDRMTDKGHEVYLCYITGTAKILPSKRTVQVIALNAEKNFYSLLKALFSLRSIIRKIRPDIIHSHMVHANVAARIVKLMLGFKTVLICTAHNKNEGGKLRMIAYRLSDFLADISTNVSQEAVEAFIAKRAVSPKKMIVMYNGIDTKKFIFNQNERNHLRNQYKIMEQTVILIAVGRLTQAKDYPNLLQACSMLQQRDYRLWIVGGGDENYKNYLQDMAEKLGIKDKVFFFGIRQDIPSLLSVADIFVLSSEWEGFGLVVAEAMACERVVVATDSGGVKEVLQNYGYLVPIKQPKILCQSIEKAMSLPKKETDRLTKKAREYIIKNFDLQNITERWLELYQRLLNGK